MNVKTEWGMECPACKRYDQLRVAVKMWADLRVDGTDADGHQEWSENSGCVCGCGWSGVVSEAKVSLTEPGLYFVAHEEEHDLSLLVRATSTDNAIAMWRHHYGDDDGDMNPHRVFLVGGETTRCGPLQWNSEDLPQVAGTRSAGCSS